MTRRDVIRRDTTTRSLILYAVLFAATMTGNPPRNLPKGLLSLQFHFALLLVREEMTKLQTSLANEQYLSRPASLPRFCPINATRVNGGTRVNRRLSGFQSSYA